MTFLNLALAFGTAACVIPIAIHLLNRRRHDVIRWGAMHLLAPVIKTNRKRIKLEQWILLLMRMAILALLGLCMSAPVLTGWNALSGNAKSSVALLFDNSYSMDAGAIAASNLELAKKEAAALVQHGPRGSDVSIAMMAGGTVMGSKVPTTNRQQTASDIRDLPSGFGTADVQSSFEHAVTSLGKMQHAKRDLVIMSDFQSADWSGDAAAGLQQAKEMIESMPLAPTVTLMQVGTEATDNVSIQSLDISPRVVAANQRVSIRVNLRNHSNVPFPGVRVNLKVDGKDRLSDSIDLGPAESGQLLLHETFADPGSHLVEVVAEADSLLADNAYTAVIPVWDRLPVLLVDGDPNPEPLKSETSFLQLALSPFFTSQSVLQNSKSASGAETLPAADLLDAKVISARELSPGELQSPRVLVLANVPRLTGQQMDAVKEFVAAGNSLLIFPGDQIDRKWYESAMSGSLMAMNFSEVDSRQLNPGTRPRGLIRPVAFRTRDDNPDSGNPDADDEGLQIASDNFDHPALDLFNDPRNGALDSARFHTWFRLEKSAAGAKPSVQLVSHTHGDLEDGVSVLARLSNGDPLLVENPYGDGRVITCATTCDDSWSNLPARPFYLPLMQRLVTYLATAVEPPRNLSVGETLVSMVPDDLETVSVTGPSGEPVEVRISEDRKGVVEFSDTSAPGVYTIEATSRRIMHYAVVAPRDESDLALLNEEEMQTLAESLGASLAASTDDYIRQDSGRRYGREIWRPLYWLMLGLVVGEVFLQQIFSGIRRRA